MEMGGTYGDPVRAVRVRECWMEKRLEMASSHLPCTIRRISMFVRCLRTVALFEQAAGGTT